MRPGAVGVPTRTAAAARAAGTTFSFGNRLARTALRRMHVTAEDPMLYWTLIFLVIALVAGLFGFGGIATASAGIAKVLFAIFLVLFLVSLIFGVIRRA